MASTINREELLRILGTVKPGLANKELIEQATSFAFMGDRVVTYNDEISISHPLPDGVRITGAVEATGLYGLLQKLKKEKLSISISESELQITSGKAKAGIPLQSEVNLPVEEVGEPRKWKKMPEDLLELIHFASFACASDMSRPILTCVHVDEEGVVEACDNQRLSRSELGKPLPVHSFLLPASSAVQLVKYPCIRMAESDRGWIHFKTEEGTVFSARVYEGEYPDTSFLLDVQGPKIRFPKKLLSILDRAKIFARSDHLLDEFVEVTLGKGQMKIRAESELGWFEEELKMSYSGDPATFVINPTFLRDLCSKTGTGIMGENKVKFVEDRGIHILALKSPDQEE